MKKLLPFLLVSLAIGYTVWVIPDGGNVTVYVDGTAVGLARDGEKFSLKLDGVRKLSFSAPGEWVLPSYITVSGSSTIHVLVEAYVDLNSVHITSDPTEARVYLSKKGVKYYIGETPLTMDFPVGKVYDLVFEKDNYKTEVLKLRTSFDVEVKARLKSKYAFTVEANIEASLTVDGKKVGTLPTEVILLPGTHTLVFESKGVVVLEKKLRVVETPEATKMSFELPPPIFVHPRGISYTAFGKTYRNMEMVVSPMVKDLIVRHLGKEFAKVKPKNPRFFIPNYTVEFWKKGLVVVDGKKIVRGKKLILEDGIHFLDFRTPEGRWLWYGNLEKDLDLSTLRSFGTLIVALDDFSLGGKLFRGPAVLNLPEGVYVVHDRKRGTLHVVEIKRGNVRIVPEDSKVAFILSSEPKLISFNGRRLIAPVAVTSPPMFVVLSYCDGNVEVFRRNLGGRIFGVVNVDCKGGF